MQIASLEVKNFRCFTSSKYTFSGPLTIIEGPNGSGKTSLLEALHYACYGKSFRTNSSAELMRHTSETFFIKIEVTGPESNHTIQIGLSETDRSIRVDGQKVSTYKELLNHYRSITITEDDIQLIKGAPEFRRTFLDQMVALHYPTTPLLPLYRRILKQRNALLSSPDSWSYDSYELWTERLWEIGTKIVEKRLQLLALLEQEVAQLTQQFFPDLPRLQLVYKSATTVSSAKVWIQEQSHREQQAGRTLFGPHLDEFTIISDNIPAKVFASRGQQKLMAILLKVAHFFLLKSQSVILLDDFMTDFDDKRAYALLDLLIHKQAHLICTVPTKKSPLALYLAQHGAEHLELG